MPELNDEQLRIRGYLQAQAAKLSVPDLMTKVRADMAQLEDAVTAASAVDHTKRPSAADWSANEVLAHLVDASARVNGGILAAWERGEQPKSLRDAIVPVKQARTPREWYGHLGEEREALFARLASATGEEHLDITWEHPFFGDLNWREWLLFLRLHDLDHARQLQQIVEAVGRQA